MEKEQQDSQNSKFDKVLEEIALLRNSLQYNDQNSEIVSENLISDKRFHFSLSQIIGIILFFISIIGSVVGGTWYISTKVHSSVSKLDSIDSRLSNLYKLSEREKKLRQTEYREHLSYYGNQLYDSINYKKYRDSVMVYDVKKDSLFFIFKPREYYDD